MKTTFIDTHIHVSDLGPGGRARDGVLEGILDVIERSGLDLRFIVSCDMPYLTRMKQDPAAMLEANRMVHDLVRRAPGKLYGSCTINPNFLDESLRVIETCFGEWGFVQLGEMLQYMMDFRMDSDAAEKCVRLAVRHDAPVQVHMATYWFKAYDPSSDGMAHMRDLLHCMDRVPEADYVWAHAVGCGPDPSYVPWAGMFLDTLAGVFDTYPRNVWVEIRDFHYAAGLRRTLREVPADRLLAGTDWTTRHGPPFPDYGTPFEACDDQVALPSEAPSPVDFMREAGAMEDRIDRVASRNARELYGLSD